MAEQFDVLVVGAGLSGLAAAGVLRENGATVAVIDRARGVGGRCATRRLHGCVVDHGLTFLHGRSAEFIARIGEVDGATVLDGWPWQTRGNGRPCQPDAFSPGEVRLAYREGLTALPKAMARDLDVRLGVRVDGLHPLPGGIEVHADDGRRWAARSVILALALEQTRALLQPIASNSASIRSAVALIGMMASLPCLTVVTGYTSGAPVPDWDMAFPEGSDVLQLVSHDSSKRAASQTRVLVAQSRPAWARRHIGDDPATWGASMVHALGEVVGTWAGRPDWLETRRWGYARVDRGSALAEPMLLELPDRGRLGLVGEMFSPGGGAEAAWLSGRRLANRLGEEKGA